MTGLGELLRVTRIERGLEVDDIAGLLNLRRSVIENLEAERYGDLPERPLTLGYTQRYARVLGLDALLITGLYPAKTPTLEIGGRGFRKVKAVKPQVIQEVQQGLFEQISTRLRALARAVLAFLSPQRNAHNSGVSSSRSG